MAASANPILAEKGQRDPTLICTGYKKPRFYLFTRSEPEYAFRRRIFDLHDLFPFAETSLVIGMFSMNGLLATNRALLPRALKHAPALHP
jgi:hypothetical protein